MILMQIMVLHIAFTVLIASTSAKTDDDGGKKKKADNELADRIKISFRSGNSRMLATCLNSLGEAAEKISPGTVELHTVGELSRSAAGRLHWQPEPLRAVDCAT